MTCLLPSQRAKKVRVGKRWRQPGSCLQFFVSALIVTLIQEGSAEVVMCRRGVRSQSYRLGKLFEGSVQVETVGEGNAEVQMCFHRSRIQFGRLAQRGDGLLVLLEPRLHAAKRCQHPEILGSE